MSAKINIMLVEDHIGYRTMLTRALRRQFNICEIHDFSTAEVALRRLEQMNAQEMPDLLLLDLNLPGISGLESIKWFTKYSANLKIIILTQSTVEEDILNAVSSGASGYLLKSATFEQITDAIQSVIDGGVSIDPKIAKYILRQIDRNPSNKSSVNKKLSEREVQILTLLAQGMARKEISDQLNITVNTVAYHVVHIYEKLGVLNAPAAVSKGYKAGILNTES